MVAYGLLPSPASGTTVPLSPTAEASAPAGGEVTVELPPPDLPSANRQGYTFDLKTTLKADLGNVPREAPVYELRREAPTAEQAQAMADKLGIGAAAQDRGDGTFDASGTGELYVSADLVQFFAGDVSSDGDLPDDDAAVVAAREWLRKVGWAKPDLGDGAVIGRTEEAKRVIVAFGPAEPQDVLSAIPSVTVTLGPKSAVVEAYSRWPNVVRGDIYQLMPAKQAWQLVQSGQAFVDADLTSVGVDPGSDVKGRATFSDVAIAYASSGPPGGQQYLQPIYVFSGKLRADGTDKSVPVTAYVPALANSGAPVG
jgi:hypothetical protein